MNILELFAHIGLKADQGTANNFLKTVKGIKGELVGAIAGTLSLAAAVKTMNSAMAQALDFKKFSADTGQSAQELQKWVSVADEVSGSGDAVAASIRAIVSNQENIKLGKGNISGYQLLGIDPRSDPFAVLEKLRGKLQGLSPAMRRNVASQFGISPDLVMTLELTNEQFAKMASRAWIIPQSSIDGLNRARASIEQVKKAFGFIQAELATKFAPVIEIATKWIIKLALMVERAFLMIDKIIRSTIGWKNALLAIGAVLAALNLSPFTIAIIALLLILEDLYVYSTGRGKSVFGVLMKEFPALAKAFSGMGNIFKDIGAAMSALFSGDMAKFDAVLSKWGFLGDILKTIAGAIQYVNKMLGETFTYLGKLVNDPLGALKADFEQGQREREVDAQRFNDFLSGKIQFGDLFKPRTEAEMAGGSGAVTATVNITGVSDPVIAGETAAREIKKVVNDASVNITNRWRQ